MDSTEYRFDGWTFRERSGELLKGGERILLQSQPQAVLGQLLRQHGELVSRADLIARLWPNGVVDYDTGLNSAVRRLRRALGDRADRPRYIETIPKRGYRFIGRLEPVVAAACEPVAGRDRVVAGPRRGWRVAAVLVLAIGAAAPLTSFRPETQQPDAAALAAGRQAEEQYQLARHFYRTRSPADLVAARRHLEQALSFDPHRADAWAALASVEWIDTVEGRLAPGEGLPRVRAAAERALTIDATLAEAHLRLAGYYRRTGDAAQGDAHYRAATVLEPEHPLTLAVAAGRAASAGRLGEAAALQRRAVEADPLAVPSRWNLATWLYLAGHLAEAEAEIRELKELRPGDDQVAVSLAEVALLQRRYGEALDLAQQMTRETDRLFARTLAYHGLGRQAESDAALGALFESVDEAEAYRIVEALAFRGQREMAFRRLQASKASQYADLRIRYSPFLQPLRADPRWAAWLGAQAEAASAPLRGKS